MTDEDRRRYQSEYQHKTMIQKKISFSRNSSDDMKLFEWVRKKRNFTGYVKHLIRKDADMNQK